MLFSLSGLLGIMYEIFWLRFFTHVVGSGVQSVSAVVSAFLLGLALGGAGLGRLADKADNQLRLYGWLEVAVGVLQLCAVGAFGVSEQLYGILYASMPYALVKWLVFGFSFLFVTLPASLIGGTLPVLLRYLVRDADGVSSDTGKLYAINTLGAALGALVLVAELLPAFGYTTSVMIASAGSVLLGVIALLLARRRDPLPPRERVTVEGEVATAPLSAWLVLSVYGLSGFAALGYQIVWARELAFIFRGTLETFGFVLAIYLGGLAMGNLIFGPLVNKFDAKKLFGVLELSAGCVALGSMIAVWLVGIGWLLCCFVFTVTLLLGGIFPTTVRLRHRELSIFGRTVGDVYAANTMGSILGAFLTGFALIPLMGSQNTLIGLSLLHVGVGLLFVVRFERKLSVTAPAVGLALAVPACAVAMPRHAIWRAAHQGHGQLLYVEENETEVLAVTEKERGTRTLWGGPFISGSTSRRGTQILQGHLAMLFHEDPKRVLEIGYGVGDILRCIRRHKPQHVDLVEIDAAMVPTANHYLSEVNRYSSEGSEVSQHFLDGRHYLAMTRNKYDVIMSDTYFLISETSTRLYTLEHFKNGADHLNEGGLMIAWVPLNMGQTRARIVANTFRQVFDYVLAWRFDEEMFLLGFQRLPEIHLGRLRDRFFDDARFDVELVGYTDPIEFLSGFSIGPQRMAELFPRGKGPIHRDMAPTLDFAPVGDRDPTSAWSRALENASPAWLLKLVSKDSPLELRRKLEHLVRSFDSSNRHYQKARDWLQRRKQTTAAARDHALSRGIAELKLSISACSLCANPRVQLSRLLSERAVQLYDDGSVKKGVALMERSLSLNPFQFRSNHYLWMHYDKVGQFEKASVYRTRARRVRPHAKKPNTTGSPAEGE